MSQDSNVARQRDLVMAENGSTSPDVWGENQETTDRAYFGFPWETDGQLFFHLHSHTRQLTTSSSLCAQLLVYAITELPKF